MKCLTSGAMAECAAVDRATDAEIRPLGNPANSQLVRQVIVS